MARILFVAHERAGKYPFPLLPVIVMIGLNGWCSGKSISNVSDDIAEIMELNQQQKQALRSLESAFKQCALADIQFCGMDGALYYASGQCLEVYANIELPGSVFGAYHAVARAQYIAHEHSEQWAGTVRDSDTYKGSGGW